VEALERIKRGKTSSELEAHRIALAAIRALNLGSGGSDTLRAGEHYLHGAIYNRGSLKTLL
jgi:hypothetical protein